MRALVAADGLVKELGRPRTEGLLDWRALAVLVLVAGAVYGAIMGSYALHSPERLLMVLYAGVKVPLLIFATSAVCMPAFFVLNTVLGLRPDFGRAVRAVLAGQAALTVALASLGPLTRFVYFCGVSHRAALLVNAAMFTAGTVAAQVVMWRRYRVLMQEPGRGAGHRVMLWAWVVMYAFVGMQMGWMLRPFVGTTDKAVTFFREEPFTNAYVVIARLVFGG
jgi:hypothetical protein